MENSKNIQKTSKCSNRNTQKEGNIVSYIFGLIHNVPNNPPPVLKGENENWLNLENWNERGPFFKKLSGQKGKGENTQFVGVMVTLLIINYHVHGN